MHSTKRVWISLSNCVVYETFYYTLKSTLVKMYTNQFFRKFGHFLKSHQTEKVSVEVQKSPIDSNSCTIGESLKEGVNSVELLLNPFVLQLYVVYGWSLTGHSQPALSGHSPLDRIFKNGCAIMPAHSVMQAMVKNIQKLSNFVDTQVNIYIYRRSRG